ncbi:hypothetical protein N864_08170 [Intrasporangium chromatireducens Q5-1]|uniref:Uncharacterized protein n=1 Tax=Intrasporangium chromatireducens Q5-1 TaxID=584657 RepID=W9GJN5_9MICO|nr:hypothetical protein N864_08170 [Intrasporangium chromatireducens Q5-1]
MMMQAAPWPSRSTGASRPRDRTATVRNSGIPTSPTRTPIRFELAPGRSSSGCSCGTATPATIAPIPAIARTAVPHGPIVLPPRHLAAGSAIDPVGAQHSSTVRFLVASFVLMYPPCTLHRGTESRPGFHQALVRRGVVQTAEHQVQAQLELGVGV